MIASDEDNYKEAIEASFKVFAPRGINSSMQQIINDSCADVNSNSLDFWVLVAALKEFIANEGGGEALLEGSIPDRIFRIFEIDYGLFMRASSVIPIPICVFGFWFLIGGSGMDLRSKARTISGIIMDPSKLPKWNYVGSSTDQAPREDSEVIIYPQAIFKDPFRRGNNILVMCDTYTPAGEPIPTNKRYSASKIFSNPEVQAEEPWYGIEQGYNLLQKEDKWPLGWLKKTPRLECWKIEKGTKFMISSAASSPASKQKIHVVLLYLCFISVVTCYFTGCL